MAARIAFAASLLVLLSLSGVNAIFMPLEPRKIQCLGYYLFKEE